MEKTNHTDVLIIMPKPPYPMIDGGTVAMANHLKLWQKAGFSVHIFFIHTSKHPFQPTAFPPEWESGINMFSEFVNTKFALPDIFTILFSAQSYQASRFYTKKAADSIKQLWTLHTYKYIVMDGLFSSVYLSDIHGCTVAPVILRSHNIEHRIWQTLREAISNPLKRWVALRETEKLRSWEYHIFSSVDGIISISSEDAEIISNHNPTQRITTIPLLIEDTANPKEKPMRALQLFHLGAMDWHPNIEGVKWFLQDVFPGIYKMHPDISFHFGGKSMPASFLDTESEGVYCYANVPDAKAFMQNFDVLVVPLHHGSGLRIKIIEAMAMGIPVVCTTKAASGIPLQPERDVLIADSPQDFIDAINRLYSDTSLYNSLSKNGIAFIQRNYSMQYGENKLHAFLNSIKIGEYEE